MSVSRLVTGVLRLAALAACAAPCGAQSMTWTVDGEFDLGTLLNVNHDAPADDQLQLNELPTPFPFINVAASGRGTVVRIDVDTGQIVGEYRTAPAGRELNPSRTTVDAYGSVWAGNRDEDTGGQGSVVKIGLVIGGTRVNGAGEPDPDGPFLAPPFDYNTCVDRDGDGLIRTSSGLGDILAWPDVTDGPGGATALVEDAEDECILLYQRVNGRNVRHVSVDAANNVWIGGQTNNAFDLLDGDTGAILAGFNHGAGGYGGLVDGNGVIWATSRTPQLVALLRYDTRNTITTGDDTYQLLDAPNAYGLGIDGLGHVFNTQWEHDTVREFLPDGTIVGTYRTGGAIGDRGVAVTSADGHVWVANSLGANLSRLSRADDGTLEVLKVVALGGDGQMPTGVAVDTNGKVWATCLDSNTAKRVDPAGGADGLGAVDMTVDLGAGADPYNYSDMTGTVLLGAIQQGTWSVVWDRGDEGPSAGCTITWNGEPEGAEPPGTSIAVEVRAAATAVELPAQPFVPVASGVPVDGLDGRYWEILCTLHRDPGVTATPVLSDLTIECAPVLGACCRPGGTCEGGMSATDCAGDGGSWLGADTTCMPDPCAGACCLPDAVCQVMGEFDCNVLNGDYLGAGAECSGSSCCNLRGEQDVLAWFEDLLCRIGAEPCEPPPQGGEPACDDMSLVWFILTGMEGP